MKGKSHDTNHHLVIGILMTENEKSESFQSKTEDSNTYL